MNKVRERKINARKHRIETIRNIGNPKQGHNDLIQREPKLGKAEKIIEPTKVIKNKLSSNENHLSGASVKKNTDKGKR